MPWEMNHQVEPGDADGNHLQAELRRQGPRPATGHHLDASHTWLYIGASRTPASSACPDGTSHQVVVTRANMPAGMDILASTSSPGDSAGRDVGDNTRHVYWVYGERLTGSS